MTGDAEIDEAESLESFADSFLRKPFDSKLLLAKVSSALRRAEYRKEMSVILTKDSLIKSLTRIGVKLEG